MYRLGENTQQACGAGGSVKPRVERSGTLGSAVGFAKARGTGDSRSVHRGDLPPASRARRITGDFFPGFRFAPPWALCFRLLRRLGDVRSSITAILIVSLLAGNAAGQKKYERPAVKTPDTFR